MNDIITWSPGVTLEDIERQVILRAFRFYRGNKTTTANALGIAIRTLDNKLEKYQSDEKEQEAQNEREREERVAFLDRQRGHVTTNPQTGTSVLGAKAGVSVESASEASSQLDMPMPQRKEVQEVLPRQVAKSGTGRHR